MATTAPSPLAFSPGSVTCFFVPVLGTSLEDTSSPGCGICISQGVTAAVRPCSGASANIFFNGRPIDFPPVRGVIEQLAPEPVKVFLETPLSLGCGFGVSAASSLTTAFALAKRFGLEKSRWELGEIVLRAETANRTGIGDPVTQLFGGVVLRRWRTGPFDAQSIKPADGDKEDDLCYRVFGPLSTREVLSNPALLERLAEKGRGALAWLEQHQAAATLEQIFDHTLDFAQESGLVTDERVIDAIAQVHKNQGRAMMVMLGQSVLASKAPADSAGWQECRIDPQGTRYA